MGPTGTLLSRSLAAPNNASKLLDDVVNNVIFTFIQGEGDAFDGTHAPSCLSQVLSITKTSRNSTSGVGPTSPFLYGSYVPEWVQTGGYTVIVLLYEGVFASIVQSVPHIAYANMPYGYVDCAEAVHYSATGQRRMGVMIFQAYLRAFNNLERAERVEVHAIV